MIGNKTQSAATLTACIAGSFSAHAVSDINVVGNCIDCTWCDGEDRKYTRSGRGSGILYTGGRRDSRLGWFPPPPSAMWLPRGAGEVADSYRASGPLFRRFRGRRRPLACKRADGRTSSTQVTANFTCSKRFGYVTTTCGFGELPPAPQACEIQPLPETQVQHDNGHRMKSLKSDASRSSMCPTAA